MIHGGLTLERYAAIGAALRYFPRGRKALVFERVGITSEAWDTARVAWSTALDSADGGPLLAEWSAAFEEAGQKLRELAPSLDSFELTLIAAPAAEPAPSAPAAEEPTPAQAPTAIERPRALPSYLAAASAKPAAVQEPAPRATHAPTTGEIPAAALAPGRGVLPFGSPLGGAAPVAQPPVAQPPVVQPAPRAHAPMARTADLEAMPKKQRPRTMPFTMPEPPAAPPISPHASPTVHASAGAQASPAQVGPPPSPASPAVSLTFNQYAALKAELSAFPNDAELIWSKYGVSDPIARDRVEQQWIATLAADPKKQQHFNAVFSQYLEQWARKR